MDNNLLIDSNIKELANIVKLKNTISGLTHNFYNYPARFSPLFVKKAIELFTEPGDLVIDPFMGGGTTILEAKSLNRNSVGTDISSLATFVTKVKSTTLNDKDVEFIFNWTHKAIKKLNCHNKSFRPNSWINKGYQRNLSDNYTWPIRKLNEQFLYEIEKLRVSKRIKNFLRCTILKTSQWALDSKKTIPNSNVFRQKLEDNIYQMCNDSLQLHYEIVKDNITAKSYCYNKSASEINTLPIFKKLKKPKLVITSPPYPGIHVVYHRWQIHGKKETPAPFWIANSLDGHGLTHYILGDRKQKELKNYFRNIEKIFTSLRKVCDVDTIIIQLVAFSDPTWQLDKYLDVMSSCGFMELDIYSKKVWRDVPNRKWYAQQKGNTSSSKEVLLIHKIKKN